MRETSICHYSCYEADARTSMDIYSASLASALSNTKVKLNVFKPSSRLEYFAHNILVMRYLRYWHYPHLVRDQHANVHHVLDHGYAHLLPKLNSGVSCVTVHDLIPMLHWKGLIEDRSGQDRPRKPWLNLKSLSYLKGFDQIIAISKSTRDDLVEFLNIDPRKITIISPAIAPSFQPLNENQVNQFSVKYGLGRSAKWVMISGREFYKNHETSLKVLKEILQTSESEVHLIKTGLPSQEFDEMVAQLGLDANVKSLYLENTNELPLLYNFVDCLLFPSLYEGFGMPVAEALACGTPVVISDRGSLPEVGGNIAQQCSPFDIKALSRAVMDALHDTTHKNQVLSEGPLWLEQFSFQSVATKIQDLYVDLLESRNNG